MSGEVVAALIGIAGTLVGGLLGAFREDVRALFRRGREPNRDLIGTWVATWTIEQPPAESVKDSISISRVVGEKVEGQGVFPDLGPYLISGRLSPANLLTLTYEGIGTKRSLGGVIIVHLNASRTEMQGHWIEYAEDRSFTRGQVQMRKSAAAI